MADYIELPFEINDDVVVKAVIRALWGKERTELESQIKNLESQVEAYRKKVAELESKLPYPHKRGDLRVGDTVKIVPPKSTSEKYNPPNLGRIGYVDKISPDNVGAHIGVQFDGEPNRVWYYGDELLLLSRRKGDDK